MRTTKKEFKTQIQEHIINTILSEDRGETIKEQCQSVIDEFTSYYGTYEQRRQPNRQQAFIDWALGLPSCFNMEYRHFHIVEIVKNWFESVGETYKEPKEEEKTYDLYYWLVYREFNTLLKQNKLSLF